MTLLSLVYLLTCCFFLQISDAIFLLQVTMNTGKAWHGKWLFAILITSSHMLSYRKGSFLVSVLKVMDIVYRCLYNHQNLI